MQQFTLTLKDNTQKAFNSFSWFLLFLHLVIISVIIINTADVYHRNVAWIAVSLFILLLFIFFFFKDKFKLINFQAVAFLLMAGFWIAQLAWVPALALIIIIIFARFILQKKSTATFSGGNIVIEKSLFKKVHSWSEVENVVLKDHLLSVDFKNNHLIQVEITKESFSINETAFNQFCQSQLNK